MVNFDDHPTRLGAMASLPAAGKGSALTPYTGTSLPARPTPTVPLPYIDTRMSRRRLAKMTDNIAGMTAATDAATRLYTSLAALETARQQLEQTHAARGHLPLIIEAQRLALLAEIARGQSELASVLGDLRQRRLEREQHAALLPLETERLRLALEQDHTRARAEIEAQRAETAELRARRERRLQLDEEEFQIRRMELAARRAAAEAKLREATALAELRGRADRHRAEADAHRTLAEAEKLRRSAMGSNGEGMPEHLRQHLAAELEIKRNRAPAAQLAQAIRDRAKAEGRDLSVDEVELIDLYESAAAAAEETIRRAAASDFEE